VLRGYRGLTDDFPTEEEGKSYEQVMSLLNPKDTLHLEHQGKDTNISTVNAGDD
jgi:hypothetical protein